MRTKEYRDENDEFYDIMNIYDWDDEVDEIDSENNSNDFSDYSVSYGAELLSTIVEETSFDLCTKATIDSISFSSFFFDDLDYGDEDDDEDDDEEEYFRGVEQQLEALRQKLEQLKEGKLIRIDDDQDSIIGDDEDEDKDNNTKAQPEDVSHRKLRCSLFSSSSSERDYSRRSSQSTQTTCSFSTPSSSEDVPDFALESSGTERQDPNTMREPSLRLMPNPPMNGLGNKLKASRQRRWIGTDIEFAVQGLPETDSVSIFLDASAYADSSACPSSEFQSNHKNAALKSIRQDDIPDFDLETPLVSLKSRVLIPNLPTSALRSPKDDTQPCSSISSSEEDAENSSPIGSRNLRIVLPINSLESPRSSKDIDALVVAKKTLVQAQACTAPHRVTESKMDRSIKSQLHSEDLPSRIQYRRNRLPSELSATKTSFASLPTSGPIGQYFSLPPLGAELKQAQNSTFLQREKKRTHIKAKLRALEDRLNTLLVH